MDARKLEKRVDDHALPFSKTDRLRCDDPAYHGFASCELTRCEAATKACVDRLSTSDLRPASASREFFAPGAGEADVDPRLGLSMDETRRRAHAILLAPASELGFKGNRPIPNLRQIRRQTLSTYPAPLIGTTDSLRRITTTLST